MLREAMGLDVRIADPLPRSAGPRSKTPSPPTSAA
jgi:hypothetical protein